MPYVVDILLIENSTGRWILRSTALGRDREFADSKTAMEAAIRSAEQISSEGRPANIVLKQWNHRARIVFRYSQDAPLVAGEAKERQKA
jgi:hypothetical protein